MSIKVTKRSKITITLLLVVVLTQLLAMPARAQDRPEPPQTVYETTDNRTGPTITDQTYLLYKSKGDYESGKDPVSKNWNIESDQLYPGQFLVIQIGIKDYSDQGTAGVGVDTSTVSGQIGDGRWEGLERTGLDTWEMRHSFPNKGTFRIRFRARDLRNNQGTVSPGSVRVVERQSTRDKKEKEEQARYDDSKTSFSGYVWEGKAIDGNRAVPKGCRGDGEKPFPGDAGYVWCRGLLIVETDEVTYWYDGEDSYSNAQAMADAYEYYDRWKNVEGYGESVKAAYTEFEERGGRSYSYKVKGIVEFTLRNTYAHLGDRPWA